MKKYIVELIGTFFLVLTIGCVVAKPKDAGDFAPLAIGSMLMVMIFAGGHISGAHYNPAVTLAVWLRGKCPTADVPGYIVAQLAGAAGAAGLVLVFKGSQPPPAAVSSVLHALLAEFIFTFAEKLLTYALGRGVEASDRPGLRAIVREAEKKNVTVAAWIEAIVKSPQFQMRRTKDQ